MDSLIAENLLAMLAVIAILTVSKRITLPLIILFYYFLYTFADVHFVSYGLVEDGPSWYLTMCFIDLVVTFLLAMSMLSGKAYVRMTFLYICYVFLFQLLPDAIQANLIKTDLRYLSSSAYEYIMTYAIQIDLLVALLGSDNFISRRVFTRS